MPLVKPLTRIGNSTGLVLDRALLKQLDLEAGGEVEISVQDNALVITPHRTATAEDVIGSAKRLVAKHRKSLERLAR